MLKKRKPSTGSYYKRKDGSWVASIRYAGKRYERRAKSKGEAREKLEQLRLDVVNETQPSRISVKSLVHRYLKHVEANKAESTVDSYRSVLKHAEALNHVMLTELRKIHISEVVDSVEAKQTRHKMFKVLKACFGQAVAWDLIEKHPMQGLKTPEYSSEDPDPFEPDEVKRLLEQAKNNRYRGAIQLAMMLGPRPSEVWGFQWDDWDGSQKLKLVRQASESRGKIQIKPPKTKAGTRILLLPDSLVSMLHTRRKEAMAEGTAGSKWIWPGLRGEVTRRSNFGYRIWKKLLADAGVSHRGFHQCRHTAATTMLNNGVAIKLVSRILGHSKVSLTLDIYNGLLTEDQNQAVEFWNRRELA